MRSIILCLCLLCGLPTIINAAEPQVQQRLGVDPVLQGLWYMMAKSDGNGQNVREFTPPALLLQATATRLVFVDQTTVDITSVFIFNDRNGRPGNILVLQNGNRLAVTHADQVFLVTLWVPGADGQLAETERWLVDVRQ